MKPKVDWNKNSEMDDLFESGGILVQRQAESCRIVKAFYTTVSRKYVRCFDIFRPWGKMCDNIDFYTFASFPMVSIHNKIYALVIILV